jgi:hypothetical protein
VPFGAGLASLARSFQEPGESAGWIVLLSRSLGTASPKRPKRSRQTDYRQRVIFGQPQSKPKFLNKAAIAEHRLRFRDPGRARSAEICGRVLIMRFFWGIFLGSIPVGINPARIFRRTERQF